MPKRKAGKTRKAGARRRSRAGTAPPKLYERQQKLTLSIGSLRFCKSSTSRCRNLKAMPQGRPGNPVWTWMRGIFSAASSAILALKAGWPVRFGAS